MDAEGDRIYFIFTGERDDNGDYIIPRIATHVSIHESITVIPAELFWEHQNIVELIFHAGVKRIEEEAFYECPRLKWLILPGVEIVEEGAFWGCRAVTYVECPMLESIKSAAFLGCESLSSINLPSAKIMEDSALGCCYAMTDVTFGKNLESIAGDVFGYCHSLQRITIPLKNGLITDNTLFKECRNLKRVDLVEGEVLRDTVDALHLEGWRIDMNEEVDSINQILPDFDDYAEGDKALAIREWIARVRRKIIEYKAQHRRLVNEATSSLQLVLPHDIVMNHVLPFLELPSHTFEEE